MFNSFPVGNEVQETSLSLSLSKATLRSCDADSERLPIINVSIQDPLFLKAYLLHGLADLPKIKAAIIEGNILIVNITEIAKRSDEETKSAINELVEFANSIQGDIARLEEERIVLTPPTAKIWRDKTSNPAMSMHAELNE